MCVEMGGLFPLVTVAREFSNPQMIARGFFPPVASSPVSSWSLPRQRLGTSRLQVVCKALVLSVFLVVGCPSAGARVRVWCTSGFWWGLVDWLWAAPFGRGRFRLLAHSTVRECGKPSPVVSGGGFGSSPNLDCSHHLRVLSAIVGGMCMSMNVADQVSCQWCIGLCLSTARVVGPAFWCLSLFPVSRSRVAATAT